MSLDPEPRSRRPVSLSSLLIARLLRLTPRQGPRVMRAVRRDALDVGRGPRLAPIIETALYRVVQEALHNAIRHAHPAAIDVRLDRVAGALRLTVHDDGRGFDPSAERRPRGARGLGLASMRERVNEAGGLLAIESAPGRGTEIRVNIPWEEGRDGDTAAPGR